MNDPWDVKSVRQSGLYVSCMKINGTPLLPPVLSQECRKEMQYYKLLAKEVERRVQFLKSYIDESDSNSSIDKLEHSAIQYAHETKCHVDNPFPNLNAGFDVKVEKVRAIHLEQDALPMPPTSVAKIDSKAFDTISSNVTIINNTEISHLTQSPKLVIDLSVSINDTGNHSLGKTKKNTELQETSVEIDLPERDVNSHQSQYITSPRKEELMLQNNQKEIIMNTNTFNVNKRCFPDKIDKPRYFPEFTEKKDGPSSLSSKSFTGSLNDIHTESVKEIQSPRLIRQRSYTVLEPSPELIAHLEVQSFDKGMDMTCISISESCSNLNSPVKKRRNWDLETAKVKWSSMAMELNQKTLQNAAKQKARKAKSETTPVGDQSRTIPYSKAKQNSEVQRTALLRAGQMALKAPSPPKTDIASTTTQTPAGCVKGREGSPHKVRVKVNSSLKRDQQKVHKETSQDNTPDVQDPATRVKDLYERVQRQQLMQMASLVEKQKKEQLLLQKMFEEQNNLLYKQLKNICPKQPIEAKEAWIDKSQHGETDRGPVSLSQLINHKALQSPETDTTLSSTLTDTGNYINQCEDALQKSRNISSNFKKNFSNVKPKTVTDAVGSPHVTSDTSRGSNKNRSNSPKSKLKSSSPPRNRYNSASDKEYEDMMLTDRTNDTMADLNFTLTTDESDPFVSKDSCVINDSICPKDGGVNNAIFYSRTNSSPKHNTNVTLKNASGSHNSQDICKTNRHKMIKRLFASPTRKEQEAASKIVAHVRGYLVRRLMRTERVQATVQTIKDALVCALQLHTDQAGIRGADVDLHRRLIQQITAACYTLHETFVASSPAERCAIIASDRARKRTLANRPPRRNSARTPDIMSKSHSGSYPPRPRHSTSERALTQSNYETYSDDKQVSQARQLTKNSELRRRPWR